MNIRKIPQWRSVLTLTFVLLCLIWYWLSLPKQLFKTPTSTVVYDANNTLLAAHIANDGQWRFPAADTLNKKFAICAICFEDKNFYQHIGFDALALVRAVWQNTRAMSVVSGGSTITMQVIRLASNHKKRNVWNKLIELIKATRLELSYSKDEILALYASNAPFGGNVVGIEAASWRYYGRSSKYLSWGEAATLAVLPNSPSLIFPGKNHQLLLKKRNRLLERLYKLNIIDSITCELSKLESLPGKPYPLPQIAPHLLNRIVNDGLQGKRIQSTIDIALQEKVNELVELHHRMLTQNGIHNAAALVLDVESGNAISYIGNVLSDSLSENGSNVDMITALRSPGSTLKPLLYASMLNDGLLLPNMLIADIPTQIAGYAPQNYNMLYNGAIPAHMALARSLNVPAVRMLKDYGIQKFNYNLKRYGITTLDKHASHYGLSIILGGAEVTMWDLASVYASMARTLNHYNTFQSKYTPDDFRSASYIKTNLENDHQTTRLKNTGIISASAIWFTFKAMVEVNRPEQESNWQAFSSSQKIAWKTGTSYGYRDAWAVGVTPKNVVVVWVGNADGEGRADLTGIKAAAPLMFDIFRILPNVSWFQTPYDDMVKVAVCKKSGYIAGPNCDIVDTAFIPAPGMKTKPCPYHIIIHTDQKGYRVTDNCESVNNMNHISWFVLPPAMEWYYKPRNVSYKTLPPFREDCKPKEIQLRAMEIIYPKNDAKIYVPTELDGSPGETVFEIAHRNANSTVFWHLDGEYIATTHHFHQYGLRPLPGVHTLTLVDDEGEKIEKVFEIVNKPINE